MANITVSTTKPTITVDSTNNIITVSDNSSNVTLGPVVSGTLANTIATSGRFETLEVGNVTTVQYQFPVDAPTVDQGLRAYANGTLYWSEDVGLVDSVNGYTGDVVLDTADLQENGNLFWTTDRGNATISAYTGDMLSINNITASYISVSNDISATNNVSGQYFNGNVNGTTGDFTGNISADTLNGNISGDIGVFTGNISADTLNGNISGDTGVFTGNVDATNFNGDVFGSISGATGVFTGNVDGSTFNGNISGDTGVFTGNVDGSTFNGNISGDTGVFTGNVDGSTFNGNINGATGDFTGNISADTLNGNISGATGVFTGNITADTLNGNISGDTGVFTGNVDATNFNGDVFGSISGTTASFTGNIDTSGVLNTNTISPITGNTVTINGELEVAGNINYVNVEDVQIEDHKLTLNYGNASAQDAFIYVDRSGSGLGNSYIKWDETTADRWDMSNGLIVNGNVDATTFNGDISGATGVFTGNISADTLNGNISGATGDFTGAVTALSFSGEGSDLTDVRAETLEVNIKNVSGANIAKGTPVHQIASSGLSTLDVIPADASNAATMPAHAIAGEDLIVTGGDPEPEGRGLIAGRITGVDTSSFQPGDTIYVAVGGGYANVAPTGEGNLIQNLGTVTKIDASNGGGEIMGAGRTNATPNLDDGKFFLGNATNQAATSDFTDEANSVILNYTGDITAMNTANAVSFNGNVSGTTGDFTGDVTANNLIANNKITSELGNIVLGYNGDTSTPSFIKKISAAVGSGLYTNEAGIVLNSTPSITGNVNAGFGVSRANTPLGVYLLWNATDNKWTFTNDGSTYYPIPTNTTDLIEGANLYYTDARVQSNTAADTGLVHTTGDETIGGIKSFTNELKVVPNTATTFNDAFFTVGGDSQQAEIRIVEYNGTSPISKSGSSIKAFANRGTEANVDYVFDHDGIFRFDGRGRSQAGSITPGNFFGFNVDDGDRSGRVPVHTEIKAFDSNGLENSGITITGAQYTDGARFYAKNSLVAKTDTAYATDTFVIGNSDPYQHTPPTANLTIGHNTDTQTENIGISYWYQYGGTLSEFTGFGGGLRVNFTATGAGELPANTVCVEFQTSVRYKADKLFRGPGADGRWAGEYIADGTAVTIKGTPTDLAANANNQTYYLKALGEFDFFGTYGEHFYALFTDAALTTPLSWGPGGLENGASLPVNTPGGDYRGYGEITYSPGDFSKFIKTSEYTTTGSGTGAEFFVSKKGSTYTTVGSNYVINGNFYYNRKGFVPSLAGGSGFAVNDTVEIDGALLGGISGTNNLTFTIDSINGSGGVTSVGNISGTAFNMSNDAWNFTKSHTDTNLYLSKEGTLHTTFGDTTTTAVGNIDANNLNATNTITSDTATFTGNVSTGNISTSILSATSADLTGNITLDTLNGNVNGATGVFTGNVDGLTFNGNINGATGDFTGNISADTLNGNISGATGDFTGNVDATNFNGNISGATGDFTGNVSASVVLSDRLQSQIDSGADIEYNNPSQRWDIARGLFVDGSIQNFSTISGYDLTATANVSGADLIASNNVSGQYFNGNVSGTTGVFTGNVDASAFNGNISGATGDFTGNVDASAFNGNIYGSIGNITTVNATDVNTTNADITTATVDNLHLKQFDETVIDLGTTNGDISSSLDVSSGTIFQVTANGNITINSMANAVAGTSATIVITQDATGNRLLSSTMKFSSGGFKTLSTANADIDIMSVFYDGSTYYATLTTGYA